MVPRRPSLWFVVLALSNASGCRDGEPFERPPPAASLPSAPPSTDGALGEAEGPPVAELGQWVNGDSFSLRALAVARCDESRRMGVRVEVRAKTRLQVSPGDFELTNGGVVFRGLLEPMGSAPCLDVLPRTTLVAGKAAVGIVLFDVPPPEPQHLEVTYQPTRWGGASRARIALTGTD